MPQPQISPSDRIKELSAINADVPRLTFSAGSAVNTLTNRPLKSTKADDSNGDIQMEDGEANGDNSVEAHKEAFTKHATDYFTQLQSIMARLRRQVYALEEAGIILAEAPTLSNTNSVERTSRPLPGHGAGVRRAPVTAANPRQPVDETERITNGGLGNLDVGYLNSRGNRVGDEKEAELVADARKMLEKVVAENRDGHQGPE